MRECNVLIVGSGLSGLSAAYHLSGSGVEDVVVVERMSGRFERYHRTCGEAVSHRMMDRAGISRGSVVRDVDAVRINCGDVCMRIPAKGSIIDRVSLLKELREASGAEVVTDSIISVRRDGDSFIASSHDQEYRCRHLIGADGAFSIVRKCIFGTVPQSKLACVNNIVRGDSDTSTLDFTVSPKYSGAYRWDFPSKDGYRSMGYVSGTDDIQGYEERGIRFIPLGRSERVVEGNCYLVGDAAIMPNPMCYGGIGAALLSGRKAAEAIASGRPDSYSRWVDRDVMFDPHFMDALETFRSWTPEDYDDAVRPFRKGYSLPRGIYAMLRRPKWANLYFSIWMAFRRGW